MPFKIAELCGGHAKQQEAIELALYDTRRFWVWYCSRRAAKTTGIAILLLTAALDKDNANCIYAGITRGHAKETIWRRIWKPLLERVLGDEKIGGYKHNETSQQTVFANGSTVVFGGLDDKRHIQTYLGNQVDWFVCDESQNAASSLLRELFEVTLGPALSDHATGKFLFSGTIPELPAGYFYDAITKGRWAVQTWTRWDNPHLTDQAKALAEHLEITQLEVTDPGIQRDWYGRLVFDEKATAYRYKAGRSSWRPAIASWSIGLDLEPGRLLAAVPPPGIDMFSIGTDPGTRDRWAFVLWGWNSKKRDVCYQVAEWSTKRNAMKRNGERTDWTDATAVADTLYAHYQTIVRFYRDAGSSQETLDLFGRFIGRMVAKAANKQDLGAQVERMATLLTAGRLKVIEGSELENDLKLARWNPEARMEARYEWSSEWHPDVGDAARYGLQGYIELPADQVGPKLSGDAFLIWQEQNAWEKRDWKQEAERTEQKDPFSQGF